MGKTKILLISIMIIVFFTNFSSCKAKSGFAILTVTIDNTSVEYKYWSISYNLTWTETEGYDCTVFMDEQSIVDGDGNIVYTYSFPKSVSVPAFSSVTEARAGILIGMYWYHPKPVKLRHTVHYTDTASGNTYTAYGDVVIHSQ